jgi:hypothetical protein
MEMSAGFEPVPFLAASRGSRAGQIYPMAKLPPSAELSLLTDSWTLVISEHSPQTGLWWHWNRNLGHGFKSPRTTKSIAFLQDTILSGFTRVPLSRLFLSTGVTLPMLQRSGETVRPRDHQESGTTAPPHPATSTEGQNVSSGRYFLLSGFSPCRGAFIMQTWTKFLPLNVCKLSAEPWRAWNVITSWVLAPKEVTVKPRYSVWFLCHKHRICGGLPPTDDGCGLLVFLPRCNRQAVPSRKSVVMAFTALDGSWGHVNMSVVHLQAWDFSNFVHLVPTLSTTTHTRTHMHTIRII